MPIDRGALRYLRVGRGWNLADLAREANVSYSLVRQIDKGETGGSEHSAKKLADALGVKVTEIWAFDDE